MSDQVHIVEMGPRDGLQNEKTPVSVADRIVFVEALAAAGLSTVEVGAFAGRNFTCWCRTRRGTRPRKPMAPR